MVDLNIRDNNAINALIKIYGNKILALLDCHIIERLKGISYLGITSSLYNKNDSNRFSHSINVAVVASLVAEKLHLSHEDKNILILYYIFHDIGHLPNSHVSEPLLRLLQSKRKFHASLGLYLYDSDTEVKKWFIENISNGFFVWDSVRNILSNQYSTINPIITEIIKSPLNPDSIEGIFRTACILEIENVLPEDIVSGIYLNNEAIYYSNSKSKLIFDFFKLQKCIYDEYVFSLANQSAEAMWKKALLIVVENCDINNIDDFFMLTDDVLISKMLEIPTSKELIENISNGKCLTPYWNNQHPNLMSNKYAEISNSIYSNYAAVGSIENKICDSVFELSKSKFIALHFNRLRQFELMEENSKQLSFFDKPLSAIRDIINIKKTQGIIPLSVFGYPFIPVKEINSIDFSLSQKIVDNILFNSLPLSSPKAIVITSPFSPNDTNIPAGPLVLKSYAKSYNIDIILADLNIKFINEFEGDHYKFTLGDHCKSNKIDNAYDFFKNSIDYSFILKDSDTYSIDILKNFPFSFEQINEIVNYAIKENTYWVNFLKRNFIDVYEKVPFVGFSIMGTSQLIISMILSRLIKKYWDKTVIMAGGSHITLKREQLQTDKRYSEYFDYFLPFHSEQVFIDCISGKNIRDIKGVIIPGESITPLYENTFNTLYSYAIDREDIIEYDKNMCTIPIQIGEGCKNGSCAMCTYNFIEKYKSVNYRQKLNNILQNSTFCNIRRVSFKDSNLYKENLLLIASTLSDLNFTWNATTHVDEKITLNDFKKLKKSGCDNLEIGVESIHNHVQKLIGKKYSVASIEKFIENAIKADISLVINLIFGFPNETKDDAYKQLEWFKGLKNLYKEKIYGSFNMLEINYGSKMSQCPSKYGIILGELQPWAFSYPWNAPSWRDEFVPLLNNINNIIR